MFCSDCGGSLQQLDHCRSRRGRVKESVQGRRKTEELSFTIRGQSNDLMFPQECFPVLTHKEAVWEEWRGCRNRGN